MASYKCRCAAGINFGASAIFDIFYDMVHDLFRDQSLFADDTSLIIALHSSQDVINNDLKMITDWAPHQNCLHHRHLLARKYVVQNLSLP